MGPFALMHRGIDGLRGLPGVWQLRRAAFDRQFTIDRRAHLFRGIFDSFEAALASAPATLPIGYDNATSANMYLHRLQIDEYDHPAMFWLLNSFAQGMHRIADVGGSVGIKYFAFGKFMGFPDNLVWRVIDVPAVVARGREFAVSKGARVALEFSEDVADASGMDVLYASGSLQYLPQTLPEMLSGFSAKPRRIVVNTTPIHPERSYITLNSIGTAYCPYRVQGRDAFVAGVQAQGYQLRDEWRNLGQALVLPFESGCNVDHYSGFCFDAKP